ncbi:Fructose-1,6-bisphosphatase/inositol-1-monophosphatase [Candidatus Anstonella stagnisolia]|nr:Fructose-1,6-bisphosphatase/inositol-1-monophosphatase [Candidatus Anstonella stagnisolia]
MASCLEIAKKAAYEGGMIAKRSFCNVKIHNKTEKDLVTSADLAAEKKILQIIRKAFPQHGIFSEEFGKENYGRENTWIIDPIDGTNNFAFGIPLYGCSVAFARKGVVQAGAVYLPELKELYWAEKGKGAFCNGKRIHVSKRQPFAKSLILMDACFHHGEKNYVPLVDVFAARALGMRNLGAAVYHILWCANGKADCSVEFLLQPYDFAAAALILEEAGGRVSDLEGKKYSLETKALVFSNNLVHEEILGMVREIRLQ